MCHFGDLHWWLAAPTFLFLSGPSSARTDGRMGGGGGIPGRTTQGDELYFTSELHAWKWNDWHNCPTFTYGSYPRGSSTAYQRGLRNHRNYDWGCNYTYYCLISVDFVFCSFSKEGANWFARRCLILNLPWHGFLSLFLRVNIFNKS